MTESYTNISAGQTDPAFALPQQPTDAGHAIGSYNGLPVSVNKDGPTIISASPLSAFPVEDAQRSNNIPPHIIADFSHPDTDGGILQAGSDRRESAVSADTYADPMNDRIGSENDPSDLQINHAVPKAQSEHEDEEEEVNPNAKLLSLLSAAPRQQPKVENEASALSLENVVPANAEAAQVAPLPIQPPNAPNRFDENVIVLTKPDHIQNKPGALQWLGRVGLGAAGFVIGGALGAFAGGLTFVASFGALTPLSAGLLAGGATGGAAAGVKFADWLAGGRTQGKHLQTALHQLQSGQHDGSKHVFTASNQQVLNNIRDYNMRQLLHVPKRDAIGRKIIPDEQDRQNIRNEVVLALVRTGSLRFAVALKQHLIAQARRTPIEQMPAYHSPMLERSRLKLDHFMDHMKNGGSDPKLGALVAAKAAEQFSSENVDFMKAFVEISNMPCQTRTEQSEVKAALRDLREMYIDNGAEKTVNLGSDLGQHLNHILRNENLERMNGAQLNKLVKVDGGGPLDQAFNVCGKLIETNILTKLRTQYAKPAEQVPAGNRGGAMGDAGQELQVAGCNDGARLHNNAVRSNPPEIIADFGRTDLDGASSQDKMTDASSIADGAPFDIAANGGYPVDNNPALQNASDPQYAHSLDVDAIPDSELRFAADDSPSPLAALRPQHELKAAVSALKDRPEVAFPMGDQEQQIADTVTELDQCLTIFEEISKRPFDLLDAAHDPDEAVQFAEELWNFAENLVEMKDRLIELGFGDQVSESALVENLEPYLQSVALVGAAVRQEDNPGIQQFIQEHSASEPFPALNDPSVQQSALKASGKQEPGPAFGTFKEYSDEELKAMQGFSGGGDDGGANEVGDHAVGAFYAKQESLASENDGARDSQGNLGGAAKSDPFSSTMAIPDGLVSRQEYAERFKSALDGMRPPEDALNEVTFEMRKFLKRADADGNLEPEMQRKYDVLNNVANILQRMEQRSQSGQIGNASMTGTTIDVYARTLRAAVKTMHAQGLGGVADRAALDLYSAQLASVAEDLSHLNKAVESLETA